MADAITWNGKVVVSLYEKGIDGGFKSDIAEMASDAYQLYLKGYIRPSTIMSGEALFRLNCEFILQYAKFFGLAQVGKWICQASNISGDFNAAQDIMDSLTLNKTIEFINNTKLFDQQTTLDMHLLRYIRNSAVHKLLLTRIDLYNPPQQISKEELEEIIKITLDNKPIPLKYRQHKIMIQIGKKKLDYMIDQERLDIEMENIEPDRRISALALGLLFSSMKAMDAVIPFRRAIFEPGT